MGCSVSVVFTCVSFIVDAFCAVSNTMFELVLALFAQLRFLATDDLMYNYISGVLALFFTSMPHCFLGSVIQASLNTKRIML